MKKALLTLSLVSSTLGFSACCESSCSSCCCEPQPNQCYDTYGYNPPYYDLNCACGITISADFLYWYGRERDLEIGVKTQQIATQPSLGALSPLSPVPVEILYPDAKWEPGVRVSLGWNSSCDGWDFLFEWTYYQNRKKTKKTVAEIPGLGAGNLGQFGLITPWSVSEVNAASFFDSLTSKWRFRYNDFQLQLGRRYWVSSCFTLRPFVGVRGTWTETKFTVNGSRALLLDPPDSTGQGVTLASSVKFDNDFWGVGITGGLQPRFYFTPCFSIFGGFDISLLWGEFELDRVNEYERVRFLGQVGDTPVVLNFKTKGEKYQMQAIADVEIGLRYEMAFCDRRYLAFLQTGWEHHYLIHHISRFRIIELPSGGALERDVVFGGLAVKAGFQF